MADPFIGEIRIMANNYAPYGWAFCNGQQMAIAQNTALYSIIGTAFGGNGTTFFNLPDFRAAAPLGTGQGPGLSAATIGEFNGAADVTLTTQSMPSHSHNFSGKTLTGNEATPAENLYLTADAGSASNENIFYMVPGTSIPNTTLALNTVQVSGSSNSHPNCQPYLAMNFCICLEGEFPVRS